MNARTEDFTQAVEVRPTEVKIESLRERIIRLLQGTSYSDQGGNRQHAYTVRSAAKATGYSRSKVQQTLLALVAERQVTYRLLTSGEHLYKLVDAQEAKWAAFAGPGAKISPKVRP